MTIAGWVICSIFAIIAIVFGILGLVMCDSVGGKIASAVIAGIVAIAIFFVGVWYYNNTASGIRALTDEQSELRNGLDRTVTVYTADGNIIAQYTGQIDLEMDQNYVKFDWQGKRYIYYNCFVETIADIP